MGQQQLLLLVLGIVIVGLAVVVGIQAFGENQKKANSDALVNDGVRIASDAQAWNLKPAAFGGGAGTALSTVATAGFNALGYEPGDNASTAHTATAAQYENLNGTFGLAASGTGVLITGISYDAADDAFNTVYVRVCGTDPADITTQVNTAAAPANCGT